MIGRHPVRSVFRSTVNAVAVEERRGTNDILYFDDGVSIRSDVSFVLGIVTPVGNAESRGRQCAGRVRP